MDNPVINSLRPSDAYMHRKIISIGSDNGLSFGQCQVIIGINAEILLIGPLGTNFNENFNRNSNIFIEQNMFENDICAIWSILSRPQCVKIANLAVIQSLIFMKETGTWRVKSYGSCWLSVGKG